MAVTKATKIAKSVVVSTANFKLTHPSYHSYLKSVFKSLPPAKQGAFILRGKAAFDAEYSQSLRIEYSHDDELTHKYLQEIDSKANIAHWDEIASRFSKNTWRGGQPPAVLSPEVQHLKLPAVGKHHKNTNSSGKTNSWELQTYRGFAVKTEKANPQVSFNKGIMDDAFRKALSKVTGRGSTKAPSEMEKASRRCLGKESEDYWKSRH